MDDLVSWLRGRLDERERELAEDERVALAAGPVGVWMIQPGGPGRHSDRWRPTRVLAEVERGRRGIAGKRAILQLHAPVAGYDPNGPVCSTCGEAGDSGDEDAVTRWPCATLRLLAQEFDGEPGWRAEWRA